MAIEIPLTKGYVTVIDDEDAHLASFKWLAAVRKYKDTTWVYAKRQRVEGGRVKWIGLHQLVTNAPDGMIVDHIDGDGLNNRRSNLRIVTLAQNQQNRRGATSRSKSQIRGVYFDKGSSKWRAQLKVNRRTIWSARFSDIESASRAVSEMRSKHMTHSVESA